MSESDAELIQEHKRLTNVLKEGNRKQLDAEYKKQKKELEELQEGKGYNPVKKDENKSLVVRGVFNDDGARITHAFESKGNGWVHSGNTEADPRPLHQVIGDVADDGNLEKLDIMRDGGTSDHYKELQDIALNSGIKKNIKQLNDIKKSLEDISKSNYGPKGAGLYSKIVNQKRKASNTDTINTIGPNKNVKQYTSAGQGTATQQANALAAEDRKKNKKQPVKTLSDLSPQEIESLKEQYNVNKKKEIEKAENKIKLLRAALSKAISEKNARLGKWAQPSDVELFGHLVTSPSVAVSLEQEWQNKLVNANTMPNVTDEQIANAKVEDTEE